MERMIELAKAEGSYQSIEVNGKIVVKGWRDCKQRWEIIKPHIKNHQTVMDIGSHYGYFAMKIARQYPDTLVWSVEETTKRARIQKLALQQNGFQNVILSRTSIDLLSLLKLQRTCESMDTILALSVIHYFPLKAIPEIIWAFSRLAQNLIMEFPNPEEEDVANKNLVDMLEPEYLLGLIYDSVKKIGESPSPKNPEIMRPIYLAQNYRITRENCMSYWNSRSGGHHTVEYKDLKWTISGKVKQYNGLNLANLKHFNVVYPNKNQWFKEGASRYYNLIQDTKGKVTDIHPRNLIVSHNGVFPIDYSEKVGKPIYGHIWKDYKRGILGVKEKGVETALRNQFNNGWLNALGESVK